LSSADLASRGVLLSWLACCTGHLIAVQGLFAATAGRRWM
jgi:hypothetical protein